MATIRLTCSLRLVNELFLRNADADEQLHFSTLRQFCSRDNFGPEPEINALFRSALNLKCPRIRAERQQLVAIYVDNRDAGEIA